MRFVSSENFLEPDLSLISIHQNFQFSHFILQLSIGWEYD